MAVTIKSFLTVFQQERARGLILIAIREDLPPLLLLQKVIRDHFGRDLTDGELAAAGKAVRVVAESLGHPHLRYNVPFSVPGAQHASGSTYVN
jgi:Zn-dependent protease